MNGLHLWRHDRVNSLKCPFQVSKKKCYLDLVRSGEFWLKLDSLAFFARFYMDVDRLQQPSPKETRLNCA